MSQIVENYLNDTSIPVEKRKYVVDQIKGGASMQEWGQKISTKYGEKYDPSRAGAPKTDPNFIASSVDVQKQNNANMLAERQQPVDPLVQAAEAAPQVTDTPEEPGALAKIGGALKQVPGAAKEKLTEQIETGAEAIRGFQQRGAQMTPAQQLQAGFTLPLKMAGGLVKMLGERGIDVAEGAVETVANLPEAVNVTAAILSGEEPDPQDVRSLEDAVVKQKEAVEGVAEFIPTPGTQFAVGLEKGQRIATEEGAGPVEALTKGAVSGVERAAAAAAFQKVAGKPTKEALKKAATKQATKKTAKQVTKVEETIAPKINKKETMKIIEEGRAVKGKKGHIFGQQKDIVEQATDVKKAAEVINKRIPGADKLDDFQMSNQIKSEISKISDDIAPEMSKVRPSKSLVTKTKETWDDLAKKQEDLTTFGQYESTAKNMQRKFTKIIDDVDNKNLDDIWKLRQEYDASIPKAVKTATDASHPSVQLQQKLWLQNRAILNDMLTSGSDDLARATKQAFDDMSSLYTARTNIIQKAKIAEATKAGLLSKENLQKAALASGTAFGLAKTKEALTGQ